MLRGGHASGLELRVLVEQGDGVGELSCTLHQREDQKIASWTRTQELPQLSELQDLVVHPVHSQHGGLDYLYRLAALNLLHSDA